MTSEQTDPRDGSGTVVQLRATEEPTEVGLDEAPPAQASYVDLTRDEAKRRPIVPEHWRTRENAKKHVSLAAARHGHRIAYHGLRSPSLRRQVGSGSRCGAWSC